MKAKVLSVILACANFLLVQGFQIINITQPESSDSSRRILFGTRAGPRQFPYFIFLDLSPGSGAGSIISNHWILTAAHVLFNRSCTNIKIRPMAWQPWEFARAQTCLYHNQYSLKSYAYDVGLINTPTDMLADGRAQAVPLPAPGTIYPLGTPATIMGWGVTETKTVPQNLLTAQLRVREWEYCNQVHKAVLCQNIPYCVAYDMPSRVLCTQGDGNFGPSTCFGDSGGPVVINGAVAGIVSFGTPIVSQTENYTCVPGGASMHVMVADYLPWIYGFLSPGTDTSNIPVHIEAASG